MKINASNGRDLVLTEIFNGVLLRTAEGNEIGICMRDDTVEINIITGDGGWHRIDMQKGTINKMAPIITTQDQHQLSDIELTDCPPGRLI